MMYRRPQRYTKVYCMSTPPQQSDDDITASLGVILDCESHVQMQGLVLGLTQEDLEALASFPSHPHRAVHLLLAMVYLILHECAVQRDCLPPSMILLTWTFLRENLLRNCGALFLRLRRRLRNQRPVVPMITHVCVLYLRDPTFRIQALRKISAIAAALASWVLLCLQASLPCKLDGRDMVGLHQVQHTPTRPAFRFALRLHGRCTLCSVRIASHIANLDGSATVVENSPKRKVLLSKPVPYAAELHELESTYRYLPLYVYASVELIEVSATTETYKCELVSSVAMAHKKTPRSVFTKGAILRLDAGRQVTVETSWDDDQRAFAVCKPAGGPVLPPMSSVWLVVESQHDKRPQWLHDLQAYICHPTIEFDGSRDCYTLFRVRLPYFTPEHIVEGGLWSRDVDWRPIIAKTPCDALVDAKFHELCASYPSNYSVKFSKFIRDCHVLPAKLSLGSLDGIFHRFAMLRFQMDLGGFRAAIALVVHHVTKKHMTNTPLLYFFLHYMILSPSMRGIWDQVG
ncbi:hypothetical protein DYB30_000755 [Aphanomyces astaci]|uniref:Uncharacterized protein n=1 Tax=Aphanomyces astaci TaxID=112090 RepID=A0A397DDV8_APHAT|nr:hypothetical protein DYB30_000755 [Aphanomyces astaci]RHZ06703.1 hypothetical protein DYB26_003663 [Aphanomyces astaci]RHZ07365.1 hypothetical protein DYB31_000363 [Aphanomyces astaci]